MKLGGVWVGWGLGDDNPKVAEMKRFLRRKLSYASALNDSTVYDPELARVVAEMQRRYGMPATGILNYATQLRCGYIPRDPADDKPMLFTVCGTGVPWWVGPDADLARALADEYRWQPVGYGARPFPMWPSITEGRNELIRLINLFPGPFALAGYSQGAVVAGQVWKHDILPVGGRLHHRLADVTRAVTFGDPMREAGKAWWDGSTAVARSSTAGILEDRHTDTPDWWRSYAHAGDLYTDCELDDEGEWKRAVCKIVMGANVFGGSDSVIAQAAEVLARPVSEAVAIVKAIIDAGSFFASGTRPHVNYATGPAVEWLRDAV